MAATDVPPHPFMAKHGASCMHADSFTTNTYPWSGPLGHRPEVSSRAMGFLGGECPTVNFDSKGRIVTVCVRDRRPSLVLLDPETLEVIDRQALPRRNAPLLRMRKAMQDTSGGAYFYLDNLDRAVIGTADGAIEIIGIEDTPAGPRLKRQERIALGNHLLRPNGQLDKITAVLPDYEGNYWFVGRYGTVGIVNKKRAVHVNHLIGEEIENSFSIAPEGAYVVSDHALYHFGLASADEPPTQVWREPYDRGTRVKVGQINRGSGTTPTLLGDDYVAITDNAEPRMNVMVYRRKGLADQGADQRLVCRTPVFEPGQSATENTLIGYGRSLIVENNAGYDIFRTMRKGKTSAPGIARVDVRADESGCDTIWESNENLSNGGAQALHGQRPHLRLHQAAQCSRGHRRLLLHGHRLRERSHRLSRPHGHGSSLRQQLGRHLAGPRRHRLCGRLERPRARARPSTRAGAAVRRERDPGPQVLANRSSSSRLRAPGPQERGFSRSPLGRAMGRAREVSGIGAGDLA
ncbi:MAG: hypothetical protein QM778_37405 [Myxococcales bacterium]